MSVSVNYFSPHVKKILVRGYRAVMATDAVQTAETRGRPRIRDDDEILRAALHAFAEHGYDGMSLRTLNAKMGLSRGTINQRFGSKEQLWYAAVDHEFRHLIDDLNAELQQREVPDDDLSRVREGIRAFLVASVRRPELVRLMNQEGLHSTRRLDYIMTSFTLPALSPLWQGLNRLADAGVVRRVPARTLFFLIAHGAAAPFTLGPLSDRFNSVDGPLDPVDHIELATDIIVSGLRIAQPDGAGGSNGRTGGSRTKRRA
jgi:AcrR family transcriptional regulator